MRKQRRFLASTLFFIFSIFSPLSAHATLKSFSAGAIVIPMDSTYQASADGGILEAYGFVFELLQNGISVYWIVDKNKTSIDGIDVTISDIDVNPIANYFNHDGTTSNSLGVSNSISYSGAPFVINYSDEATLINILATTASDWSAVDFHKVAAPFTANVIRELTGTPPKIALMNNGEDKTSGNAAILEAYLRLAGICTTNYDIITPGEVETGILATNGYDLMWAPHWAGYEKYPATVETIVQKVTEFLDSGKSIFAECASIEVFEHSANGQYLSTNGFGHNGVAKDITPLVPPGLVVYNDKTSPFSQSGDFDYEPTGGHLHNWRPFQSGDPYSNKLSGSPATPPDSAYAGSVSRFTFFDVDGDVEGTTNDQWDYYVGGRKDGDSNKGYVVYLGGHKYASCSGGAAEASVPNEKEIRFDFNDNVASSAGGYKFEFEFEKDLSNESFTFKFYYSDGTDKTISGITSGSHNVKEGSPVEIDFTGAVFDGKKIKEISFENTGGSDITLVSIDITWTGGHGDQKTKKIKLKSPQDITLSSDQRASTAQINIADVTMSGSFPATELTIKFYHSGGITQATVSDASHNVTTGTPLEVDFTGASFNGNQIENVILTNIGGADLTLTQIDVSWTGGPASQRVTTVYDVTTDQSLWSGSENTLAALDITDTTILNSAAPATTSCTNNSDCTPTNIAAVRYVLNTLFNLQFTVVSQEFIRSTPVVEDSVAYQGTFEYPSFKGHFKAFDVTNGSKQWDSADSVPADASRVIFTYINGVKQLFTTANIANLRTSLDVTPANGDDSDELDVIKRVRGLVKTGAIWGDTSSNKLGGVEHSAPALIGPNDRTNPDRNTVAYIGTIDGMLHALDINQSGKELWAFIPENVLPKLQNDRTDPNAINDFAAVDASPTARDVYIDHDSNGSPSWRTVITSGLGDGGNSIFAIDVTDPATPVLLWEKTQTGTGLGYLSGMGNAFRTTISKVKGSIKYSVLTATNYADKGNGNGGIQVFSYDLETGTQNWQFSADYTNTINDIPGAIASFDEDGDSFADRVVIGDMEGRLWELDINNGTNPNKGDATITSPKVYVDQVDNTITNNVPLYNAGSAQPIAASPSVVKMDNHLVVIFGTGGTDWSDNSGTYSIIGVDVTDEYKNPSPTYATGAATSVFSISLDPGEKVWSSPTIAAGQLYIATAFGVLEGADPADNLLDPGSVANTGNIHAFDLSLENGATLDWTQSNIGQVRSSVFMSDEHLYASTLGGMIVQTGDNTYNNPLAGGQVKAISWRDMNLKME